MRRLFLLALWPALVARALAAEIAPVRAVPLQLSLPFAAALAAPAVSPVAAAPAVSAASLSAPALAAPVAAAPVIAAAPAAAPRVAAPLLPGTPAAVAAAFYTGDPAAYLKAARAASYEPPESDDAQTALYREGLDREAADRAFFAAISDEGVEKAARKTKIDYEEFSRQVARRPVDSGVFRDTDAKRRILKASGYDALIGPGGRRIRLEDASDARVGQVFLNVLKASRR